MFIESVMPSNRLILCHPLLLLPSIFPSIRVFSNELVLHIRWPKYWSFSFSISPSNLGLISFVCLSPNSTKSSSLLPLTPPQQKQAGYSPNQANHLLMTYPPPAPQTVWTLQDAQGRMWATGISLIMLYSKAKPYFFFIFFSPFIFISWRLITLQYCSGFCHTLTWISHGFTCIPHPDPPSHLHPHPILFWKNETILHCAKRNSASDSCIAGCHFGLSSLGKKDKGKHMNMDMKTKEDTRTELSKQCSFFLVSIHFCQNRSNHRVDNFLKVSNTLSLIVLQFSNWT